LDALPTSLLLLHLDDLPAMAELEDAISRLKTRKAGVLSEIFLELVLCGGLERLFVLMQAVWREGFVLKDWRDAACSQEG